MKTQFAGKRKIMIFFFILGAALVLGAAVMGLWNAILPQVLGVKTITFLQALGILILSKILFGGFRGRGGYRHSGGNRWMEMQQKMNSMTTEEKEKFKAEWKNRCGGRWRRGNGSGTTGTADQ